MKTHILAHRFKVSDTAGSIGISTRSLQRRLAECGLSYLKLLEQTRIETAQTMLDDEDIKLQDVASELGYRHSTHFSRAFRRVWCIASILSVNAAAVIEQEKGVGSTYQ